jgi:hypothetical protein
MASLLSWGFLLKPDARSTRSWYHSHGCRNGRRMDARVAWRRTCLTGLACVCLVWVSGCAVGRDESTGAIILGFEAGRLVETGPQALAAAAGALIPGAGPIIGTIAGVLGIGGAVHYRSRRNGERAGWDERGREVVDSPAGPVAVHPERHHLVHGSGSDNVTDAGADTPKTT